MMVVQEHSLRTMITHTPDDGTRLSFTCDGTIISQWLRCIVAGMVELQRQRTSFVGVLNEHLPAAQHLSPHDDCNMITATLERLLTTSWATLDSVAEGVMVVGFDGSVYTYNRKFEQLWNLPEEWPTTFSDKDLFLYVADQVIQPESFKERVRALYEENNVDAYDTICLKDGRVFARRTVPYRVQGKIEGRVWSFQDITNRERAESELHTSRAHLKAIFDNASAGICLLTLAGDPIQANDRWAAMIGYTPEEIYQTSVLLCVHPQDYDDLQLIFEAIAQGTASTYTTEKRFVRKDGSVFWGHLSLQSVHETEVASAIVAVVTDITERKMAEETQRQVNEQLMQQINELQQRNLEATLLTEMGESLQSCMTVKEIYQVVQSFAPTIFAHQSGTLYISHPSSPTIKAEASWGEDAPHVESFSPGQCWVLQHRRTATMRSPDVKNCCKQMLGTRTEEGLSHICVPLIAQNTMLGVFHLRSKTTSLYHKRQAWIYQLTTTIAEHIALALANLHLRDQLKMQSIRDTLTGLFNRRYLDEVLERELYRADRYHHTLNIMMIDVDHFKQFNDTYGHDGGDALLRALGEYLQRCVRGQDIACRYGGEEIVLIFPRAQPLDIYRRAEQIRQEVKELAVEHRGGMLGNVTISVGVASFPTNGSDGDAVLKAADKALYQAKASGRDRVIAAFPLNIQEE